MGKLDEENEDSSRLTKNVTPPSKSCDSKLEPKDTFRIVYLIMVLNGIGFLLPWNVFINAAEYFKGYKLNTAVSANSTYRSDFLVYVGLSAQIPNLLFSGLNAFYQPGARRIVSRLPTIRVVSTILVIICTLLVCLILACLDTSSWPYEFFVITLLIVMIMNAASAVYTSVCYGLAAYLPLNYSNAIIIGTNTCGTLIAVLNIITKASAELSSGHQLRDAAIGYFSVTVLIMFLCLGSYFYLKNSPFFTYHMERSMRNMVQDLQEDKADVLLLEMPNDVGERGTSSATADKEKLASTNVSNGHCDEKQPSLVPAGIEVKLDGSPIHDTDHDDLINSQENVGGLRNCFALCCVSPMPEARRQCNNYWKRYKIAVKKCWIHYLSVWSTLFCTLVVFPAILVDIKRKSSSFFIPDKWFTDVTCFLFFNLFALIGNVCASLFQFPGPRYLFIPVWVRTVFFIPFFLFSNFRPGATVLNPVFANDYGYIVAIIVFSYTSGYLSSLSILYARNSVVGSLKDIASMLAVFSLTLGLFCGIQGSLLLTKTVMK